MARARYTAEARVTGGRDGGHGSTPDGELDVTLQLPKELGGRGGGTNPEQLFAVGYAACFEAVLSALGKGHGVPTDDAVIDAKVMLLPDDGKFKLGAELHVTLPSIAEPERAAQLVRDAHQMCPYSSATRGNIDVVLTANGVKI